MRDAITAHRFRMFVLPFLLAHLPGVLPEQARVTAAEPNASREQEFDQLTKLVPTYVLRPQADGGTPFELIGEPILRWTNPVRKTRDGATFLWLDGVRPATVMCAFWAGENGFKHEFHSLHREPLTGTLADESVWMPNEAGVSFGAVPGSPKVAENDRLRLIQMRQIASTYQGSIVPSSRPAERLRLLSQPLYRYDGQEREPDLIGGAIFAFVQTTDPEILVLIEAKVDPSGMASWHVGFARMSRWPLQVTRKSEVVWSCEWGAGKMEDAYRVLSHQVQ